METLGGFFANSDMETTFCDSHFTFLCTESLLLLREVNACILKHTFYRISKDMHPLKVYPFPLNENQRSIKRHFKRKITSQECLTKTAILNNILIAPEKRGIHLFSFFFCVCVCVSVDVCLFVLRFYGPVNPMGHAERGQFT